MTSYRINVVISQADGTPVYDSGQMQWDSLSNEQVAWWNERLGTAMARVAFLARQQQRTNGFSIAVMQSTLDGDTVLTSVNGGANNLRFSARMQMEKFFIDSLWLFARMVTP